MFVKLLVRPPPGLPGLFLRPCLLLTLKQINNRKYTLQSLKRRGRRRQRATSNRKSQSNQKQDHVTSSGGKQQRYDDDESSSDADEFACVIDDSRRALNLTRAAVNPTSPHHAASVVRITTYRREAENKKPLFFYEYIFKYAT